MPRKYSQKLINRLIEYFWKYHNLTISEDQADEYLDSMADLYAAISQRNASG